MKLFYTLMIVAALACCANAYVDESLISLGVGVSEDSWNALLNAAILPIISDTIIAAGGQLPPNCCYKNVEVARTGLYLENFSLPAESVKTTGSIQTTPKGPFVTVDIQFDLDFYYKLCIDTIEDRCTTLFFCKGDSRLHFDATTSFLVDVRADSNGEPIILINDFDFHLAIPVKSGLCEFLSAGIDVILPLINEAANIKLPTILDSVLASFTSNLNQTIVVSGQPFNLMWQLTNQSQSSAVGTSLMFVLNVLEVASGNKPGPFVPKPIPNALSLLTYNDEVLFEVSSAVFNNIIYSYYSLKQWEKVFEADGFKITATFLECPDITFQNIQSGADGAALHLNVKMAVKKFGVPFTTAKANVTVYFELEIASDGTLYPQLSEDKFDVDIYSTSPPLGMSTIASLENLVTTDYYNAVDGINAGLEGKGFKLPQIANFNEANIIYGDEFVTIEAASVSSTEPLSIDPLVQDITIAVASTVAREAMSFTEPADYSSRVLSCPNLGAIGATSIECPDV